LATYSPLQAVAPKNGVTGKSKPSCVEFFFRKEKVSFRKNESSFRRKKSFLAMQSMLIDGSGYYIDDPDNGLQYFVNYHSNETDK
jgi:hypothetical protein